MRTATDQARDVDDDEGADEGHQGDAGHDRPRAPATGAGGEEADDEDEQDRVGPRGDRQPEQDTGEFRAAARPQEEAVRREEHTEQVRRDQRRGDEQRTGGDVRGPPRVATAAAGGDPDEERQDDDEHRRPGEEVEPLAVRRAPGWDQRRHHPHERAGERRLGQAGAAGGIGVATRGQGGGGEEVGQVRVTAPPEHLRDVPAVRGAVALLEHPEREGHRGDDAQHGRGGLPGKGAGDPGVPAQRTTEQHRRGTRDRIRGGNLDIPDRDRGRGRAAVRVGVAARRGHRGHQPAPGSWAGSVGNPPPAPAVPARCSTPSP